MVKVAAWLAWTQFSGKEVKPEDVAGWIEAYLLASDDDEQEDGDTPQNRDALEAKLMQIFDHPEVK